MKKNNIKYKQFRLMANSQHFFVFFKRIEINRRGYRSQMYYISIASKGVPTIKTILEKIINFRRNIRKIHFEDLDKNLTMSTLKKVI